MCYRFTKINIEEPTTVEAKKILRNAAMSYEIHYGFDIEPSACDLAVDLSAEYVFNKKLPDKAFDVIDRACAFNKIQPIDEQVTFKIKYSLSCMNGSIVTPLISLLEILIYFTLLVCNRV